MSYGNVAMARPDGAHFSDAGAEAVADWLMKQVLAN
jgi:lysophospholipase L1-like esterase